MIDHHVHTTFSFDGKQTLQAACQAAMEAGLTGLVITDHVDTGISWKGSDFCIADPAAYRAAIEQAKADFPQLSLLRGMEPVSYTHLCAAHSEGGLGPAGRHAARRRWHCLLRAAPGTHGGAGRLFDGAG